MSLPSFIRIERCSDGGTGLKLNNGLLFAQKLSNIKLNNGLLFAQKLANINVSRSAAPKLPFVPACRYFRKKNIKNSSTQKPQGDEAEN